MGCAGKNTSFALGDINMAISRDAFVRWIQAFAAAIAGHKDYLTELDSAIGDADHGINLDRGFQAVLTKLPAIQDQDIGTIAKSVGMGLISTVGGASGPLYGTLFLQIGLSAAGKVELGLAEWAAAFASGVEGVIRRGKASLGDKTMVDSLLPAQEALQAAVSAGSSLPEALGAAEKAAYEGMLRTVPMIAKKGRASYLGERSIGAQDPGATSAYLLVKTAADTWGGAS